MSWGQCLRLLMVMVVFISISTVTTVSVLVSSVRGAGAEKRFGETMALAKGPEPLALPSPCPSFQPVSSSNSGPRAVTVLSQDDSFATALAEYARLHQHILQGTGGAKRQYLVCAPTAQMGNRIRFVASEYCPSTLSALPTPTHRRRLPLDGHGDGPSAACQVPGWVLRVAG
jgi:hypothetical protein